MENVHHEEPWNIVETEYKKTVLIGFGLVVSESGKG